MKYLCLVMVTLAVSTTITIAQRASIHAVVFDSVRQQPVPQATITLLLANDASLVSFTMSDDRGAFFLDGLPAASYELLITHTAFHNKKIRFTLAAGVQQLNLGSIGVTDKSVTFQEVIVQQEAPPVTLVGDTIQYNAPSFRVAPNATVEELLKKLPGLKVDRNGEVKAQGEKVQRVLVDGKEFFGNDPKLATRNLPADAIDKVQVYDKASDQAVLTGFDDGNSERTINLKLKKERKKGFFGKASAGGGTSGRYNGRFNMNRFAGARQVSALGMANNANMEGFSFMDILNFSGGGQGRGGNNGTVSLSIADDDPLAGLLGANTTGINNTLGTGINFNDVLGSKTDLRSSYFFSRYNPYRETEVLRQYFTPANRYRQAATSNNVNVNHRMDLAADIFIDSFQSLKISSNLAQQQTKTDSRSAYRTLSAKESNINTGNSSYTNAKVGYTATLSMLYRRKFQRRGRSFSATIAGDDGDHNGNGYLQSATTFYDTLGSAASQAVTAQQQQQQSGIGTYSVRLVYTEPFLRNSLLEISAATGQERYVADQETFDFNAASGKFDIANAALTSNFRSDYRMLTTGLRWRRQGRKFNAAAGITWQDASLQGTSASMQQHYPVLQRSFQNFLPNARFQFRFSRYKTFTANYNTSTSQPAIRQLQPLPDNSDPLSIKTGTPSLVPEYIHLLRMNASLVNPFSNRHLFAFLTLQATRNKIVNSNSVNVQGIDTVRQVNVNGVYTARNAFSYSFPVRKLKGSLEVSSNNSYNRGKQLLQGKMNTISQWVTGPSLRLDMDQAEQISWSLVADLNFVSTKYSLTPAANNRYSMQDYGLEVNWQRPRSWYISTNFNYRITAMSRGGFNQHIPLWQLSVSKQVLHFNRGELKLTLYDLLNKNLGISRNANLNYIEDTRTNNLRRYAMLSFTYNLAKTGLSRASGSGPMIRR